MEKRKEELNAVTNLTSFRPTSLKHLTLLSASSLLRKARCTTASVIAKFVSTSSEVYFKENDPQILLLKSYTFIVAAFIIPVNFSMMSNLLELELYH